MRRGEVWIARLDPVEGSEQAGTRPVLIFQDNALNGWLRTVVVVPLTTNVKWAAYPFCVLIASGEGGLKSDSVVLAHQIRVLDKTRLIERWGRVDDATLELIEQAVHVMAGM